VLARSTRVERQAAFKEVLEGDLRAIAQGREKACSTFHRERIPLSVRTSTSCQRLAEKGRHPRSIATPISCISRCSSVLLSARQWFPDFIVSAAA